MKLRNALIAAILFVAGPAMAQTQPGTAAPPAAQHTPGTKAPAAASTPADKLDPAKETAIRHLMDITETSKMCLRTATYVDKVMPNLPEDP